MVYVHIDNYFTDADYPEDTESDFHYKLARPVNNVELMKLKYARLPILPTIIAGWNDKVYYYCANDGSGATLLEATLTAGYYTEDELVAELNTKMTANATSCTFSSTYDANTGKMTLVGSENTRFATSSSTGVSTANGEIFKRFALAVGYYNVLVPAATSIVMTYAMRLVSVRYFTIVMELNGFQNPECINRNHAFSFVIPNQSTDLQGNVFYSEEDYSMVNNINHVNVNRIHVKTFLENSTDIASNFLDGYTYEYLIELVQSNKYAYVGRSKR